jgi:hypothetical protein
VVLKEIGNLDIELIRTPFLGKNNKITFKHKFPSRRIEVGIILNILK